MPLFLRISATDWLEENKDIKESWTGDDTVKLAPLLAERGVDLLDVSTGGNHPAQHPHVKPAYQAPFAIKVKEAIKGTKMAVGSVGSIDNAKLANDLLEKDNLDLITIGRGFQKVCFFPSCVASVAGALQRAYSTLTRRFIRTRALSSHGQTSSVLTSTCQTRFDGALVVEARSQASRYAFECQKSCWTQIADASPGY